MSDVETINTRLRDRYGRAVDRDLPLFRVVRAETQVEKRKSQVTAEGFELLTGFCIREVKKYSYIPPCWILEIYCPMVNQAVRDAVDAPYTYEPMLPMLDPDDNPLPLSWKAIEFAVQSWLTAEKSHRNQGDIDFEEELRIRKEEEQVHDELGGKYSTADALHYGDAVFIPSKVEDKVDERNDSVNVPKPDNDNEARIIS
jgi:hypothetical protein